MSKSRSFMTADDMRDIGVDAKVGLLATLSAPNVPHITLITSLESPAPEKLTWGQFSEGVSKENLRAEPRAGFLVMTMDRRIWRGRARRSFVETEGERYEHYNRKPMFRYNSYFGIHSVHHMDLVDVRGPEPLPLARMLAGQGALSALGGTIKVASRRRTGSERVLNHWTERLLFAPASLKFLSFVGEDGFPTILPAVPAAPYGGRRLIFTTIAHPSELSMLRPGMPIAIFAMSGEVESVLVRGRIEKNFGARASRATAVLGSVFAMDIDFVYNTMPPTAGRIYPLTVVGM